VGPQAYQLNDEDDDDGKGDNVLEPLTRVFFNEIVERVLRDLSRDLIATAASQYTPQTTRTRSKDRHGSELKRESRRDERYRLDNLTASALTFQESTFSGIGVNEQTICLWSLNLSGPNSSIR
jgi:hypothetical protein